MNKREIEDMALEVFRLKNENTEYRAAIKDAFYCAENTPWKEWWASRYADLLPKFEFSITSLR